MKLAKISTHAIVASLFLGGCLDTANFDSTANIEQASFGGSLGASSGRS
jgi:hypothetical protein